jgi:hypothetical protein
MNKKFDELAKGMAQSVTRRRALKKFGVGFCGIVLASLGLTNRAQAGDRKACLNRCSRDCSKRSHKGSPGWQYCYYLCSLNCPDNGGGG